MTEVNFQLHSPAFELPPNVNSLLRDPAVLEAIGQAQDRYLHWDEFQHKSWVPGDKKAVWSLVQLARRVGRERSPIKDQQGPSYTFNPAPHAEFLHQVDLELGGIFLGLEYFNDADRRHVLRRNLVEEAIASSQLEGANTSRAAAKKMIAEGRPPRDKGETMIVNNHEAMRWIEEDLKNRKLTQYLLMELHARITEGTIDKQHLGKLRNTFDEKGKPLVIKPWDDKIIAYTTPPRGFVERELPKLIAFANDETSSATFIHPLVKAIMLHFWVGLLHPFEDGNGRLARILFYWYMLRKGYWAFAYLSLSERLLKSPRQYAMAFIYAEQDTFDLNYFIHYNIAKIKLARTGLEDYVRRKIEQSRKTTDAVRKDYGLNPRQISVIEYLSKDERRHTSLSQHMRANEKISKMTAVTDLKKLVDAGLVKKAKSGRNVFYYLTTDATKLLG